MTAVTYFAGFNVLSDWPGRLFEGDGSTAFVTKTSSSAVIKHGAGHSFANFSIKFSGTGFTYSGGTVTGGKISAVTIADDTGATILKFTNVAATSIGADFSSIAGFILGLPDADGGTLNPDGKVAWSNLMSTADTITGTSGRDRSLVGIDPGNDTYKMLGGDDEMLGGLGNDKYDGGDGFDRLSFAETTFNEAMSAFRGIAVDMTTLKLKDCWGGTDTLVSVEDILGSRFADTFLGNAGEDQFSGLMGRDLIDGGGGNNDKVYYYEDVWQGGHAGIVANLSAGTIRDGFGNTDTVARVEWVLGTRFDDKFTGSARRDVFVGDAGKDSYDGRGNPADSGEGDRVQFNWTFSGKTQHGIDVDLGKSSGQIIDDGYGNTENAVNIEGMIGSDLDDVIKGGTGTNLFAGADGKDIMTGGGGIGEFVWWDVNHFDDGDVVTDFNAARDKLSFDKKGIGIDALRLENDTSPDTTSGTFLFDAATHTLFWDGNGSGAGGRHAVVVLDGVTALTAANFELY